MATKGVSPDAARAAQELVVLYSRLRRQLREVAGFQGLTPTQTSVLSRLSKTDAMTASELAAAERVRPQSVAATLTALEQERLITRRPDPSDGRRQLVALNAEGRRRIAGSRQARTEWLSRAIQERYDDDERKALVEAIALLERIVEP